MVGCRAYHKRGPTEIHARNLRRRRGYPPPPPAPGPSSSDEKWQERAVWVQLDDSSGQGTTYASDPDLARRAYICRLFCLFRRRRQLILRTPSSVMISSLPRAEQRTCGRGFPGFPTKMYGVTSREFKAEGPSFEWESEHLAPDHPRARRFWEQKRDGRRCIPDQRPPPGPSPGSWPPALGQIFSRRRSAAFAMAAHVFLPDAMRLPKSAHPSELVLSRHAERSLPIVH